MSAENDSGAPLPTNDAEAGTKASKATSADSPAPAGGNGTPAVQLEPRPEDKISDDDAVKEKSPEPDKGAAQKSRHRAGMRAGAERKASNEKPGEAPGATQQQKAKVNADGDAHINGSFNQRTHNEKNTHNEENTYNESNTYNFYSHTGEDPNMRRSAESDEQARPKDRRITPTRLDPEAAAVARRAYQRRLGEWQQLWTKHRLITVAAQNHDAAWAISGMLAEGLDPRPEAAYECDTIILDKNGILQLIEDTAALEQVTSPEGKQWLLFIRAKVDSLPEWNASVQGAFVDALERVSGRAVLSLHLTDGSLVRKRDALISERDLPLAYFVARARQQETEPADLADEIIRRLPSAVPTLILRDSSLLWDVIEQHAYVSESASFVASVVEDLTKRAAENATASALTDGCDEIQRSLIHTMGFVGLHFHSIETPVFFGTVRNLLAQLDQSKPIVRFQPPPADAPEGTKAERVVDSRTDALAAFGDQMLKRAGLISKQGKSLEFRDQPHRQRMLEELRSNPLAEIEYLGALLRTDILSASASSDWCERLAALLGSVAIRWPGEFRALLDGRLAPPEANIFALGGSLELYMNIIRDLSVREGGSDIIDVIGHVLLNGGKSQATFLFHLIRWMAGSTAIDGIAWIRKIISRYGDDGEFIEIIRSHLLTRIVRTENEHIKILGDISSWIDFEKSVSNGAPHQFAVRFLQEYAENSLPYWQNFDHDPFEHPLIKLALGNESDKAVLKAIVNTWRRRDGAQFDESLAEFLALYISPDTGWLEYNIAYILGFLAGATASDNAHRSREAALQFGKVVREIYSGSASRELAELRLVREMVQKLQPFIEDSVVRNHFSSEKAKGDKEHAVRIRVRERFAQFRLA
jgi:hypothetical protein